MKVLDKSQELKWVVHLVQIITYNHEESRKITLGAPNPAKVLAPHGRKGSGVRMRKNKKSPEKWKLAPKTKNPLQKVKDRLDSEAHPHFKPSDTCDPL